jgi:protein-S-isoprenylcysteine O-methyltransferase Ste14
MARHRTQWPLLLIGAAVVFGATPWSAAVWFAASRLAYVLFVGVSLRREEGRLRRDGHEAAWNRFARRSSWLMNNDAVAFTALCIVTADGFAQPASWPLTVAVGAVLVALGVGVKSWAAASLPAGSYHWRNFFVAPEKDAVRADGPYRWMSSPMYTVGYAHCYGAALALQSPAGMVAAAGAQASILLLHFLVEEPHLERLRALESLRAAAQAEAVPASGR